MLHVSRIHGLGLGHQRMAIARESLHTCTDAHSRLWLHSLLMHQMMVVMVVFVLAVVICLAVSNFVDHAGAELLNKAVLLEVFWSRNFSFIILIARLIELLALPFGLHERLVGWTSVFI